MKFGQEAAVAQDIPAVTAVLSQSADRVETTQSRQSPQHQAANTRYVLEVLGLAANHTLVQRTWDAVLM